MRGPALGMGALVLGALALGACATPGHLPGPGRIRAWPAAPEQPRIGLLGEFHGPTELGMRRGFAGKVFGFATGVKQARLYRPYALAVFGTAEETGPGGVEAGPERIAVADTGAKVVHVYELSSGRIRTISKAGPNKRLRSPVAVAYDGDGRLYVCDSALGLLLRYDAAGRFDRVVSRGLGRPAGLAIDPERGVVYVSDAGEHAVRRFGLDGEPRGALRLPLRFPTHLALDRRGRLVISDSMNFRVVVVSPDGKLASTTGRRPGDASGDLQRPKGVGLDSEGHLYVVDALFDNVQIFDLAGHLLLAFGSAGDGPGEFALPAGLAIDRRDLIYVADAYNGRIQVFRYIRGKPR